MLLKQRIFRDGKINYIWLIIKLIKEIRLKAVLICTINLLMLKRLFMIKFVKKKKLSCLNIEKNVELLANKLITNYSHYKNKKNCKEFPHLERLKNIQK